MSLTLQTAEFYVGIDWAAETHAVCVLDERGRKKTSFSIAHSAAGFAELIVRLGRLAAPADVAIGIERPDRPARRRPAGSGAPDDSGQAQRDQDVAGW